jgi:CHAT domain-containing protein
MYSAATSPHRSYVFGLPTTFTNKGATAYLGPIWPIGDSVAFQMGVDFYSGLLLERATVGEALFVAKRNAKQRLEDVHFPDLSWASMISYGDFTMKLLDSLGIAPVNAAQLDGSYTKKQRQHVEQQQVGCNTSSISGNVRALNLDFVYMCSSL